MFRLKDTNALPGAKLSTIILYPEDISLFIPIRLKKYSKSIKILSPVGILWGISSSHPVSSKKPQQYNHAVSNRVIRHFIKSHRSWANSTMGIFHCFKKNPAWPYVGKRRESIFVAISIGIRFHVKFQSMTESLYQRSWKRSPKT